MHTSWQVFRLAYIIAGTGGLLLGPIAFLTFKGGWLHRRAGWVYAVLMLFTGFSAIALGIHFDNPFFIPLGAFSSYLTLRGVRSLHQRGLRSVAGTIFDGGLITVMACLSGWMLISVNPILMFFGVVSAVIATQDLIELVRPAMSGKARVVAHMRGMSASYMSALSAFSATNLRMLPPFARFAWPVVLGVPLLVLSIRRYQNPSLPPLLTRGRKIFLALITVIVMTWLGLSYSAAYSLTHRLEPRHDEPLVKTSWGTLEPLRLRTTDGQDLGAWYAAGADDGLSVVLLHGNGADRSQSLPLAEMLHAEGCHTLLVTLRAHGDSTGEINDLGWSGRHDVQAAVAEMERRRPGKKIVVQGTSLGAAAAIYAAHNLGDRVSGYVLESPYADLYSAVRHRCDLALPWPLSRVAYVGMATVGPSLLPAIDLMAPAERIRDIPPNVPVLLVAGGRDQHLPVEEVRAMRDRLGSRCRWLECEEDGHELFCVKRPERYRAAMRELLATVKNK